MWSRSSAASLVQRRCIRAAVVCPPAAQEAGCLLFVAQGFATLDLPKSLVDLAHEPVVVADKPLNCFAGDRLRVGAAVPGDAGELGLQFRR